MPWACGPGRKGSRRVNRGGSWNSNARNVRAAYRNWNDAGNANSNLGFRLARAQPPAGWRAPDPTWVASGPLGAGKDRAAAGVEVAAADARTNPRRRPISLCRARKSRP